jgi:hypothetical protein
MKKIEQFEPSQLRRFEEDFLHSIRECNGDPSEVLLCIECMISNTEREIFDLRHDQENLKLEFIRLAVQSDDTISYRPNCNSPADADSFIADNQLYIEFLKMKRNSIPKNTILRNDNEKFELLRILGLFETKEWNAISMRRDQDRLLSEILVIHIDTAKDLLNSLTKKGNAKGRLTINKREELESQIKSMHKGG